jgi:hypothetical protein
MKDIVCGLSRKQVFGTKGISTETLPSCLHVLDASRTFHNARGVVIPCCGRCDWLELCVLLSWQRGIQLDCGGMRKHVFGNVGLARVTMESLFRDGIAMDCLLIMQAE